MKYSLVDVSRIIDGLMIVTVDPETLENKPVGAIRILEAAKPSTKVSKDSEFRTAVTDQLSEDNPHRQKLTELLGAEFKAADQKKILSEHMLSRAKLVIDSLLGYMNGNATPVTERSQDPVFSISLSALQETNFTGSGSRMDTNSYLMGLHLLKLPEKVNVRSVEIAYAYQDKRHPLLHCVAIEQDFPEFITCVRNALHYLNLSEDRNATLQYDAMVSKLGHGRAPPPPEVRH